MADKAIMDALWRDGYNAAAHLIEKLENSINRDAELKWLKAFACEMDDTELAWEQLRCLWTAYCFHHNLDVDTKDYDDALCEVWHEAPAKPRGTFESLMCRNLV